MGGIPCNYHGEVVTLGKDGFPDTVVPGLFAVGEASCVSVHGANRLGSNSLIDLVVFGRATGHRLKEILKPGAAQPALPKDSADLALGRLDHFRNAERRIADCGHPRRNAARDVAALRPCSAPTN